MGPHLLKLPFRAHFTKRVKEQQSEGRGQLWASGPLSKLTASGGLLGEEKVNAMMPHLATSRRCPTLMAAEATWFSYFISMGFGFKFTNMIGSSTYLQPQETLNICLKVP